MVENRTFILEVACYECGWASRLVYLLDLAKSETGLVCFDCGNRAVVGLSLKGGFKGTLSELRGGDHAADEAQPLPAGVYAQAPRQAEGPMIKGRTREQRSRDAKLAWKRRFEKAREEAGLPPDSVSEP
jgi:hypothetical protein